MRVIELNTHLQRIADQLPGWLKGIGRAKSEKIEAAFRISAREVRLVVQYLRSLGDPDRSRIGSDSDGYFWSDNLEDFDHTLANLDARARSIFSGAAGIRKSFPHERQVSLGL